MSAHRGEPRAYARYRAAFHRRIAKLTPNVPLRSMYVTLLDFFENDAAAGELPGAVPPATWTPTGSPWTRSSGARCPGSKGPADPIRDDRGELDAARSASHRPRGDA
jgi:hypothetical protein